MLVGHVGIGKVLLCFIVLNVVVVTPRLCERYWAVLVYVVSQVLVLGWEDVGLDRNLAANTGGEWRRWTDLACAMMSRLWRQVEVMD